MGVDRPLPPSSLLSLAATVKLSTFGLNPRVSSFIPSLSTSRGDICCRHDDVLDTRLLDKLSEEFW